MRKIANSRMAEDFPKLDLFLRPKDRLCPLKQGDELYSDLPDAEPDEGLQFKFEIGLAEPQVQNGASLSETLREFVTQIEHVIRSLTPYMTP